MQYTITKLAPDIEPLIFDVNELETLSQSIISGNEKNIINHTDSEDNSSLIIGYATYKPQFTIPKPLVGLRDMIELALTNGFYCLVGSELCCVEILDFEVCKDKINCNSKTQTSRDIPLAILFKAQKNISSLLFSEPVKNEMALTFFAMRKGATFLETVITRTGVIAIKNKLNDDNGEVTQENWLEFVDKETVINIASMTY